MLNILLPSLPYDRSIDPMWQEEMETAQRLGYTVFLFDAEQQKLYGRPNPQWPSIYRGWMLTAAEYQQLEQFTPLLVPLAMYLASHQASGWYEQIAAFTPPSQFINVEAAPAAIEVLLTRSGKCFVKGLSKSFGSNSVITSLADFTNLRQNHHLQADEILFVREFVELAPQPEQRFFAVRNQAFGAAGQELPKSLRPVLAALENRWLYTIDVAFAADGSPVIIEVGDGQVSDVKEWSVSKLYETVIGQLAVASSRV
ncbi:MAG: ATP-grasp domain-containing protein [Bacteroidota bacterium]|nr:ATP-grasp domain-containing protein [Bacteroidota bacterium]